MKKFLMIAALILSAAAFANAQTVPAEYKAEVVKMLDATHARSLYVQTLEQTWTSMGIANASKMANGVADDLWPDLVNEFAAEYAKYLNLQDMKNLNAFYATPTGIKVCDSLNAINASVMNTVQTKYASRIQNLVMKYM